MITKTTTLAMLLATVGCGRAPQLSTSVLPPALVPRAPLVAYYSDSVGVIHGRVRDQAGQGLPSALVILDAASSLVATDSLGRFRIAAAPGSHAVLTRAIGYESRADSLVLSRTQGLGLDIVLHRTSLELGFICACDPEPAVTLQIRRPRDHAFSFLIVTLRERHQILERDSIASDAFVGDTVSRTALWAVRTPELSRRLVDVDVQGPGYRPWQRRTVRLPTALRVMLETRE